MVESLCKLNHHVIESPPPLTKVKVTGILVIRCTQDVWRWNKSVSTIMMVRLHLLLVLALGDEARLDAVARLQEGAALRQLARVVRHHARHVACDQRRHRAVDLLRKIRHVNLSLLRF